uniref:Triple functional domain protein n=1 Tax=Parasteatoda tepidariorum TaxID=114398 RepID=A0A2L2XWE7_PARTP
MGNKSSSSGQPYEVENEELAERSGHEENVHPPDGGNIISSVQLSNIASENLGELESRGTVCSVEMASNSDSKTFTVPEGSELSGESEPVPNQQDLDEASDNDIKRALLKRKYVLQEMVDTEKDYVRDLRDLVEGYMKLMRDETIPVPENLKNGKDKIIFGNIEAIYEWHRDLFCTEIDKCLEEPERLGPLFQRCERKLQMYVVYCQNKPKSEYIVSEYVDTFFEEARQFLQHRLQIQDLLIKPVQRIMKYQLLLREFVKATERAKLENEAVSLRKAVQIMHVVPKSANDMMNVGRLQNFPGKITGQGRLLHQGLLQVSDPATGKMKERQVFLFEQVIIFSEVVGARNQFSSPSYYYKNHIAVNKMALEERTEDNDPTKFMLKSKDPSQPGLSFVIQAKSVDDRNDLVALIRSILDTQMDFLRALQSPIAYQKELTKDISAPELGTLWNPSLRKTLSHPAAAHKSGKSPTSVSGGSSTSKSLRCVTREKKYTDNPETKNTSAGQPTKEEKDLTQETMESQSLAVPNTTGCCKKSDVTDLNEKINIGLEASSSRQRKNSLPLDKHLNLAQQSPPFGKKNFLEGFKNALRLKSKTDSGLSSVNGNGPATLCSSHSLDSSSVTAQKNIKGEQLSLNKDIDMPRRWSEINSSRSNRPSSVSDLPDDVSL